MTAMSGRIGEGHLLIGSNLCLHRWDRSRAHSLFRDRTADPTYKSPELVLESWSPYVLPTCCLPTTFEYSTGALVLDTH